MLAVASTLATALFSAAGSGAGAQTFEPVAIAVPPLVRFVSDPVVQAIPADTPEAPERAPVEPAAAPSLRQLVTSQELPSRLSSELNCLAGAVYFEAKGESLDGQLAVARVVIARSRSGRFPASYCGVVHQPSQFSFVRRGAMPAIPQGSATWRTAVAIARIADGDTWASPVEGALFFHAARVSPGWRLRRVARVDNHVFYR